MSKNDLALLVLDNCKEFGEKVEQNLLKIRNETNKKYIAELDASRFSNGEGKVKIKDSVRDKEIYILCDIGNYGVTYKCHGKDHEMMPDEHFQDIKRVISATCGHSAKMTVVMPLLYQARQHRRKGRESLDCAIALQELERLGVKSIMTFDAHDPNVINATPSLSFDNFYPSGTIIEEMASNDPTIFENAIVISPDFGAMERARYYAEIIGCDVGVFYKRRDLSKLINGKNPVVAHTYMGSDVKGKNVIVVDDMIASGESVLDIALELKKRNAKNVYVATTFAFFTEGLEKFNKYYNDGIISRVYSTNLTYAPQELLDSEWFMSVDLSDFLSKIINRLNKGKSISPLMDATAVIRDLLVK